MAAELVGIHRNTARLFCHCLRRIIAQEIEDVSSFVGPIEVDESYLVVIVIASVDAVQPSKCPFWHFAAKRTNVHPSHSRCES